jgi:hypothetical protein
MAKNAYKLRKKRHSLFSYLEKKIPLSAWITKELPSRYIGLLIFSLLLGLLYVANTHYYERKIRILAKLEQEVEALRVETIALKSSYMLDSKQSSVAQRVAPLGLYESTRPPTKIKIPK